MTLATLQRQARTERLHEEAFSKPHRVDRKAGIIYRVKVLGRKSKNGREYSTNALREAADHYGGMRVNVDHNRANPNAERKISDRIGVLRNVKVGTDGVYADLHYLTQHALGPQLGEMAEKMPDTFGLSHNADGMVRRSGGKVTVESISRVNSVDVVGIPATTNNLFESVRELFEHESSVAKLPVVGEDSDAGDLLEKIRTQMLATLDDGGMNDAQKIVDIRALLKLHKKAKAMTAEVTQVISKDREAVAESCVWTGRPEPSIRLMRRRLDERTDYEKFAARHRR